MAKRKPSEADPAGASFEVSLAELQSIVAELEEGSLGLEASLERFEKGIGLLRTCYSILESAEAKVEVLTCFNADGPPDTAPFVTTATFQPSIDQAANRDSVDREEADADDGLSLF